MFYLQNSCYVMKKLFLLTCSLFLAAAYGFAQEDDILEYQYDPVADKGIGFANSKGEIVIPADRFAFVYESRLDKITFVLFNDSPKGIYAINRKGEPLFEVFCFDNGPDYVQEGVFRILKDGKMGFANMDGEVVIKPQFDFVWPFQECGYAVFNTGGKRVIYDTHNNYSTWKGGKWGIINKKGEMVLPPTYEENYGPRGFIIDGKRVPIEEVIEARGLPKMYDTSHLQAVDTARIKDPFFKVLYKRYLTTLPFERNVLNKQVGNTLPYRTNSYFQKTYPFYYDSEYIEPKDLNLYCHYNDTVKEPCEEAFIQVIGQTTGDYLLAVLYMIGVDHSTFQYSIVTYDYEGNYIDQLPFAKRYDNGYRKEGLIREDLKIFTYELTFDTPQMVYTTSPRPTGAKFDDKIGQRMDCIYTITQDGHFKHLKKFLYKPKLYTSDYFFNKGLIKKGGETSIWTLQPNN